MKDRIEKIPFKKVGFYAAHEEEKHLEILQKMLFRLMKDRLYTRFIPFRDFANYLGVNHMHLKNIVYYYFGFGFRQLIFVLRTIDTLSFAQRYECRNLGLQELCRFSGSSISAVDRLSKALGGSSLKAILKGRINLATEQAQKRDKEYKELRNAQQKRNTLFLESIKSKEWATNDRYDKTYIDQVQPSIDS